MIKAVSIKIEGKVQGVGFRYHTKKVADELSICGFVRNMSDGSVYVEAIGEDWAIEQFTEWCKLGPSWAKVTHAKVGNLPVFEAKDFTIK